MAKLTVAELTTPVTQQQVQTSIYQVLAALGTNVTQWKAGSVVRTMIAGASAVMAAFTQQMADVAASGFLALATGPWLKLVAEYVYNVLPQAATFASGTILATNSGGGVYALDPGDLIVASTLTGRTYHNTSSVTIGAHAVDVVIAIEADESGSASSAAPEDITTPVTPLAGVTVRNPAALVGLDDETDASIRERCTEKLGALSPMGPWDAYASALRNATRADGSNIGVTRVRLMADGFGRVFVWAATASGGVPDGDDLDACDAAVQTWAAPQSVTAVVDGATNVLIPITYQAWMYNTSGRNEADIKATIATALGAYMAAQPVGGNVISTDPGRIFANALRATILTAMPEIFDVALTVPLGPYVTLAISEVGVLGTLIGTITQVPPPQGAHV